jgi:DNA-directed RNA polymerase specialized sigma24 family protein
MEMNSQPLPKKEWALTEEAFSKFLNWLDSDKEKAGEKYEEIRHKLIKLFTCRGCACPEDLSDETINRVIRRVQEIGESYEGDPSLYFYGVARNVHLEYLRKRPGVHPIPSPEDPLRTEAEYVCLEKCLESLPERSRNLVLQYYREEKRAKIDLRKQLAIQLGIPFNALVIRAFRIRKNLERCVFQCLQENAVA